MAEPIPDSGGPEIAVDSDPPSSRGPVAIDALPEPVGKGSVLGERYRLEKVLGRGGTATVYLASDLRSVPAESVAVKVLHPELGHSRPMRERFLREAYVANKIQHPSVVSVLADGIASDGSPYLVMELLEGETLEARWERKGYKLPPGEVLWVVDRLLDVLAAAHAKGIVHRDVKPENLWLTPERRLKVLDFGIARLREAGDSAQAFTTMGQVMGTPAFMPPEQASGRWDEVGAEADLWAVGASMFALLTGRLVHEGSEVHELVQAAVTKPAPSLREVAPGLPEALVELVDYALCFDREKRWRSARLMQHAVRRTHEAMMLPDAAPGSDDDGGSNHHALEMPELEPPPPSLGPSRLAQEPKPVPPPAASQGKVPLTMETLPAGAKPPGKPAADEARPAPPAVSRGEAMVESEPSPGGKAWVWALVATALLLAAAGALLLKRG